MISKAVLRYCDTSPQKARLVVDTIRGKSVGEAVAILRGSRKRVARHLVKLLHSAIANAEQREDMAVDVDRLKISRIFVDGASLRYRKRTWPTTMGRAFRKVRRQSHITLELDEA